SDQMRASQTRPEIRARVSCIAVLAENQAGTARHATARLHKMKPVSVHHQTATATIPGSPNHAAHPACPEIRRDTPSYTACNWHTWSRVLARRASWPTNPCRREQADNAPCVCVTSPDL